MKKFSKISAILASVAILGVSAFATITYANGENKPTVTAADTSESNSSSIDGCTIVMRSFYAGYIINDSDIDAIKAEAANDDNPNRKNLKEIINALDNGQHYDDTEINCEYVIVRRKGNEDVTFELPWSTVKVYDLRGYNFSRGSNFYNDLDDELQEKGKITGKYGSFVLYQ